MSERLYVGTRKGLFELRRNAAGQWLPMASHFLGEPLSMLLADPRDGALYAALNLGHFGVKLWRRDAGATDWMECAVPVYPPQPPAAERWKARRRSHPGRCSSCGSSSQAAPTGPARCGPGPSPAACSVPTTVAPAGASTANSGNDPSAPSGSAAATTIPASIPSASTHATVATSPSRCPAAAAEPRRRPQLDLHHQRHARRLHAAGAERGGGDPGPAPPGAVPGAPGVPLGAAPQRHLPFPRRRPALAGRGRRAVQLRLRRRRASAAAGHGLVRPGDQDECRIPRDARFVVTRTRDGGRSFETLERGLPDGPAYDLVYRHGLDIDPSGERLAMGSTTGGLWLSENGGRTGSSSPPTCRRSTACASPERAALDSLGALA